MQLASFKAVRAVVFDFDGTLAETNIDFALMRRRIIEHIKAWGLWHADADERRYVLELIAYAEDKLAAEPRRRVAYRAEADQILEDVEMLTCPQAHPFPGIVPGLHRLADRGYGVGIITRNCRRGVKAVTDRYHLRHDVLLTRDDVEKVKPDKAHLLQALAMLEAEPDEAVMVGDHPTDIEVGKAAGTLTCGVLTDRTERDALAAAGADLVVESAARLADLLCHDGETAC